MNKEWYNIVRKISKLSHVLEITFIFIEAVFRRFCNLFLTNRTILYPYKVRVLQKKCVIIIINNLRLIITFYVHKMVKKD